MLFTLFLGPDLSVLEQYIETDPLSGNYVCKSCGKSDTRKGNLKNHVEAIHFAGHFIYSCSVCGKTFNGKNNLAKHMTRVHRTNR